MLQIATQHGTIYACRRTRSGTPALPGTNRFSPRWQERRQRLLLRRPIAADTAGEAAGTPRASEVLLTVPEACGRLRVSRWTLYRLIQTGQLETVRIGRARRVPTAAIDSLIERLRREAA